MPRFRSGTPDTADPLPTSELAHSQKSKECYRTHCFFRRTQQKNANMSYLTTLN